LIEESSQVAGYDRRRGKSNNAVDAERENWFPASLLAQKLGVSTATIKETMEPVEWHHTSGWFNETDYYDGDLLIRLARGEPVEDASDLEIARAREALAQLRAYRRQGRGGRPRELHGEVAGVGRGEALAEGEGTSGRELPGRGEGGLRDGLLPGWPPDEKAAGLHWFRVPGV
jgi:hypothetical protein